MRTQVPPQHPAVVLRSQYAQLRALLAIAMIAVVGLTTAVVVLVTDDGEDAAARTAAPLVAPAPAGTTRYDGGPEEGTRGPFAAPEPPVLRYDGGPEEGTRGPGH